MDQLLLNIIFNFFNSVQNADEIIEKIKDDPAYGSAKSYGLTRTTAENILAARDASVTKSFTSFAQIDAVSGVGPDAVHNIIYTFEKELSAAGVSLATSTADYETALLDFFNQAADANEICLRIYNDPAVTSTPAGIASRAASAIIKARSTMPGGRFQSAAEVDAISGVGETTFQNILYSFQRPQQIDGLSRLAEMFECESILEYFPSAWKTAQQFSFSNLETEYAAAAKNWSRLAFHLDAPSIEIVSGQIALLKAHIEVVIDFTNDSPDISGSCKGQLAVGGKLVTFAAEIEQTNWSLQLVPSENLSLTNLDELVPLVYDQSLLTSWSGKLSRYVTETGLSLNSFIASFKLTDGSLKMSSLTLGISTGSATLEVGGVLKLSNLSFALFADFQQVETKAQFMAKGLLVVGDENLLVTIQALEDRYRLRGLPYDHTLGLTAEHISIAPAALENLLQTSLSAVTPMLPETIYLYHLAFESSLDFRTLLYITLDAGFNNWAPIPEIDFGVKSVRVAASGEWPLDPDKLTGKIEGSPYFGNLKLPNVEGLFPIGLDGLNLSIPTPNFTLPSLGDLEALFGGLSFSKIMPSELPDFGEVQLKGFNLNLSPDLSKIKGLAFSIGIPGITWDLVPGSLSLGNLSLNARLPGIDTSMPNFFDNVAINFAGNLSLGSVMLPSLVSFELPGGSLGNLRLSLNLPKIPDAGLEVAFSELNFSGFDFSQIKIPFGTMRFLLKDLHIKFDPTMSLKSYRFDLTTPESWELVPGKLFINAPSITFRYDFITSDFDLIVSGVIRLGDIHLPVILTDLPNGNWSLSLNLSKGEVAVVSLPGLDRFFGGLFSGLLPASINGNLPQINLTALRFTLLPDFSDLSHLYFDGGFELLTLFANPEISLQNVRLHVETPLPAELTEVNGSLSGKLKLGSFALPEFIGLFPITMDGFRLSMLLNAKMPNMTLPSLGDLEALFGGFSFSKIMPPGLPNFQNIQLTGLNLNFSSDFSGLQNLDFKLSLPDLPKANWNLIPKGPSLSGVHLNFELPEPDFGNIASLSGKFDLFGNMNFGTEFQIPAMGSVEFSLGRPLGFQFGLALPEGQLSIPFSFASFTLPGLTLGNLLPFWESFEIELKRLNFNLDALGSFSELSLGLAFAGPWEATPSILELNNIDSDIAFSSKLDSFTGALRCDLRVLIGNFPQMPIKALLNSTGLSSLELDIERLEAPITIGGISELALLTGADFASQLPQGLTFGSPALSELKIEFTIGSEAKLVSLQAKIETTLPWEIIPGVVIHNAAANLIARLDTDPVTFNVSLSGKIAIGGFEIPVEIIRFGDEWILKLDSFIFKALQFEARFPHPWQNRLSYAAIKMKVPGKWEIIDGIKIGNVGLNLQMGEIPTFSKTSFEAFGLVELGNMSLPLSALRYPDKWNFALNKDLSGVYALPLDLLEHIPGFSSLYSLIPDEFSLPDIEKWSIEVDANLELNQLSAMAFTGYIPNWNVLGLFTLKGINLNLKCPLPIDVSNLDAALPSLFGSMEAGIDIGDLSLPRLRGFLPVGVEGLYLEMVLDNVSMPSLEGLEALFTKLGLPNLTLPGMDALSGISLTALDLQFNPAFTTIQKLHFNIESPGPWSLPNWLGLENLSFDITVENLLDSDLRSLTGVVDGTLRLGDAEKPLLIPLRLTMPVKPAHWTVEILPGAVVTLPGFASLEKLLDVDLDGYLPSGLDLANFKLNHFLMSFKPKLTKLLSVSTTLSLSKAFNATWDGFTVSLSNITADLTIIDPDGTPQIEYNIKGDLTLGGSSLPIQVCRNDLSNNKKGELISLQDGKTGALALSDIEAFFSSFNLTNNLPLNLTLPNFTINVFEIQFEENYTKWISTKIEASIKNYYWNVRGGFAVELKTVSISSKLVNNEMQFSFAVSGSANFGGEHNVTLNFSPVTSRWLAAIEPVAGTTASAPQLQNFTSGFGHNHFNHIVEWLPFNVKSKPANLEKVSFSGPFGGAVDTVVIEGLIKEATFETKLSFSPLIHVDAPGAPRLAGSLTFGNFKFTIDDNDPSGYPETEVDVELAVTELPFNFKSKFPAKINGTISHSSEGMWLSLQSDPVHVDLPGVSIAGQTIDLALDIKNPALTYGSGNTAFKADLDIDASKLRLKGLPNFVVLKDTVKTRIDLDSVGNFKIKFYEWPFAFPAVTEKEGWTHLDLADLGELRLKLPVLDYTGNDFKTSGEIEVVRDIALPLSFIKNYLNGAGLGALAGLFPDSISASDVLDLGNKISSLGGATNHLPENLRLHLASEFPARYKFDIAGVKGGSVLFDIESAPNDTGVTTPLRVATGGIGLTVNRFGLGEMEGIPTFRIDGAVEIINLPVAASLSLLGGQKLPLLPDPDNVHITLKAANIFGALAGAPIPIFFDEISLSYLGVEGLEAKVKLTNPMPKIADSELAALIKLAGPLTKFLTDPNYFLSASDLSSSGVTLKAQIEDIYVKTPEYLGSITLGHDGSSAVPFREWNNQDAVTVINLAKRPRVADIVQLVGSFTGPDSVSFGPIQTNSAWGVTSYEEFVRNPALLPAEFKTDSVKALFAGKNPSGMIVVMGGSWSKPGLLSASALFGINVKGMSAAGTMMSASGSLGSDFLGFSLNGAVAVDLSNSGVPLALNGTCTLTMINTQIASLTLGLSGNTFTLSGSVDVIKISNLFSASGTLSGSISSTGNFSLSGNVSGTLLGVSFANLAASLNNNSASLKAMFLGNVVDFGVTKSGSVLTVKGNTTVSVTPGSLTLGAYEIPIPGLNYKLKIGPLSVPFPAANASVGLTLDSNGKQSLSVSVTLDFLGLSKSLSFTLTSGLPTTPTALTTEVIKQINNNALTWIKDLLGTDPLAILKTAANALHNATGYVGSVNLKGASITSLAKGQDVLTSLSQELSVTLANTEIFTGTLKNSGGGKFALTGKLVFGVGSLSVSGASATGTFDTVNKTISAAMSTSGVSLFGQSISANAYFDIRTNATWVIANAKFMGLAAYIQMAARPTPNWHLGGIATMGLPLNISATIPALGIPIPVINKTLTVGPLSFNAGGITASLTLDVDQVTNPSLAVSLDINFFGLDKPLSFSLTPGSSTNAVTIAAEAARQIVSKAADWIRELLSTDPLAVVRAAVDMANNAAGAIVKIELGNATIPSLAGGTSILSNFSQSVKIKVAGQEVVSGTIQLAPGGGFQISGSGGLNLYGLSVSGDFSGSLSESSTHSISSIVTDTGVGGTPIDGKSSVSIGSCVASCDCVSCVASCVCDCVSWNW